MRQARFQTNLRRPALLNQLQVIRKPLIMKKPSTATSPKVAWPRVSLNNGSCRLSPPESGDEWEKITSAARRNRRQSKLFSREVLICMSPSPRGHQPDISRGQRRDVAADGD